MTRLNRTRALRRASFGWLPLRSRSFLLPSFSPSLWGASFAGAEIATSRPIEGNNAPQSAAAERSLEEYSPLERYSACADSVECVLAALLARQPAKLDSLPPEILELSQQFDQYVRDVCIAEPEAARAVVVSTLSNIRAQLPWHALLRRSALLVRWCSVRYASEQSLIDSITELSRLPDEVLRHLDPSEQATARDALRGYLCARLQIEAFERVAWGRLVSGTVDPLSPPL